MESTRPIVYLVVIMDGEENCTMLVSEWAVYIESTHAENHVDKFVWG